MTTFADLAQSVLTTGIDAFAETQVARYQANDPTPQNRGTGTTTGPAGQPTRGILGETFSNPTNLILLAVAAVLVVVLVKRL